MFDGVEPAAAGLGICLQTWLFWLTELSVFKPAEAGSQRVFWWPLSTSSSWWQMGSRLKPTDPHLVPNPLAWADLSLLFWAEYISWLLIEQSHGLPVSHDP